MPFQLFFYPYHCFLCSNTLDARWTQNDAVFQPYSHQNLSQLWFWAVQATRPASVTQTYIWCLSRFFSCVQNWRPCIFWHVFVGPLLHSISDWYFSTSSKACARANHLALKIPRKYTYAFEDNMTELAYTTFFKFVLSAARVAAHPGNNSMVVRDNILSSQGIVCGMLASWATRCLQWIEDHGNQEARTLHIT